MADSVTDQDALHNIAFQERDRQLNQDSSNGRAPGGSRFEIFGISNIFK